MVVQSTASSELQVELLPRLSRNLSHCCEKGLSAPGVLDFQTLRPIYWSSAAPARPSSCVGEVFGTISDSVSLRQDPLDLRFWSFLTFLHHGIEQVERHLLWKFHKKIQRKSWSNVPPKLLACLLIRFLYKTVHKIGRLRKFNRARETEFNCFHRLDYLYETWHTCLSCSWLQKFASDFSIFA